MRKFFCTFAAFVLLSLTAVFSFAADTMPVDATFDASEVEMIGLPDSGEAAVTAAVERLSASPGAEHAIDNEYTAIATIGAGSAEHLPLGGAAAIGHSSKWAFAHI